MPNNLHLDTDTVYCTRVRAHSRPAVLLDAQGRYSATRHPSTGAPVFSPDPNGGYLAATFDLSRNPFVHPDAYLDEHEGKLYDVDVKQVLAWKTGQPAPCPAGVTISILPPYSIEACW